jgi:hypothetical protein
VAAARARKQPAPRFLAFVCRQCFHEGTACTACGRDVESFQVSKGRRRKYCCSAHRQKAYYWRKKARRIVAPEPEPLAEAVAAYLPSWSAWPGTGPAEPAMSYGEAAEWLAS